MRLLFAISVACFCTVLWLALTLARRLRRHRGARRDDEGRKRSSGPAPATEFFEAGEFRTPRVLRLNQDVSKHSTGRTLAQAPPPRSAEPNSRREPADLLRAAPTPLSFAGASPLNGADDVLDQTAAATRGEAVIVDSKLQFVAFERPLRAQGPQPIVATRNTPPRDLSGERKSPQSVRSGTFRRVDLSHYNKDLGDLTDPYTQEGRNSGIRPSVAKSG